MSSSDIAAQPRPANAMGQTSVMNGSVPMGGTSQALAVGTSGLATDSFPNSGPASRHFVDAFSTASPRALHSPHTNGDSSGYSMSAPGSQGPTAANIDGSMQPSPLPGSQQTSQDQALTPASGTVPPQVSNKMNASDGAVTPGEQAQGDPNGDSSTKYVNPKFAKFEERIAKNDDDVEAWQQLFLAYQRDYEERRDDNVMRQFYDRFLTRFPTSVRHWLMYLEMELRPRHPSNHTLVSAVFGKCLRSVPSVVLYREYIKYIRRLHDIPSDSLDSVPKEKVQKARATIQKSYEFTLDRVGMDRQSGDQWLAYINFVNDQKTSSTYEEQQKMDVVRKTFQKAVALPLNNVEQIWKAWDAFESNLNKLTARKFLADKCGSYMNARAAARQLKALTDQLDTSIIPSKPKNSKREIDQIAKWRRYIEWEMSDPLKFEDKSQLLQRVSYAYKQCLLVWRHHPMIWFDYAMYVQRVGKLETCISVLKDACEACPMSFLLHFRLADLEEGRSRLPAARDVYEGLGKRIKERYEQLEQSLAQKSEEASNDDVTSPMKLESDEQAEKAREAEKEKHERQEAAAQETENKLRPEREAYSLAMIMYMRFARRTEGVKAARLIFARTRKEPLCTYHVFVASALMEHHCSKDTSVAGKIFELGLKTFGMDPDYVLIYINWLMQLNDDNNLRALFERVLAATPAEKAKPIWEKYLEFEGRWGDLNTLLKLEARWMEAYMPVNPERDSVLPLAMKRYSTFGLEAVFASDLGLDKPSIAPQSTARDPERSQNESSLGISANPSGTPDNASLANGRKREPDFKDFKDFKASRTKDRQPEGQNNWSSQRTVKSDSSTSTGRPSSLSPGRDNNYDDRTSNWEPRHESRDSPYRSDPITSLLSRLPSASTYNGPRLIPDEILRFVSSLSIPQNSGSQYSNSSNSYRRSGHSPSPSQKRPMKPYGHRGGGMNNANRRKKRRNY